MIFWFNCLIFSDDFDDFDDCDNVDDFDDLDDFDLNNCDDML